MIPYQLMKREYTGQPDMENCQYKHGAVFNGLVSPRKASVARYTVESVPMSKFNNGEFRITLMRNEKLLPSMQNSASFMFLH